MTKEAFQLSILRSELADLDKRIDTVDTTVSKSIPDLTTRVERIERPLRQIEQTVVLISDNLDNAITEQNDQHREVMDRLDAVERAYGDLSLTHEETLPTIDQVIVDVETIEGDVTTISQTIDTINGDVVTISQTVNTINGNVNTIQQTVNSIDGNVDSIVQDISNIEGDITTINQSISNVEGDISSINLTITDVQGDIDTIKVITEDVNIVAIEANNIDVLTLNGEVFDPLTGLDTKASIQSLNALKNLSDGSTLSTNVVSNTALVNSPTKGNNQLRDDIDDIRNYTDTGSALQAQIFDNTVTATNANATANDAESTANTALSTANSAASDVSDLEDDVGNWTNFDSISTVVGPWNESNSIGEVLKAIQNLDSSIFPTPAITGKIQDIQSQVNDLVDQVDCIRNELVSQGILGAFDCRFGFS